MPDLDAFRKELQRRCLPKLHEALRREWGNDGELCAVVASNVLTHEHWDDASLTKWWLSRTPESDAAADTWTTESWPKIAAEILSSQEVQDCLAVVRVSRAPSGSADFEEFRRRQIEYWNRRADPMEGGGSRSKLSRCEATIRSYLSALKDAGMWTRTRGPVTWDDVVALVCDRVFGIRQPKDGSTTHSKGGESRRLDTEKAVAWVELDSVSESAGEKGAEVDEKGDGWRSTLLAYKPVEGGYFRSFVHERFRLKARDVARTYGFPDDMDTSIPAPESVVGGDLDFPQGSVVVDPSSAPSVRGKALERFDKMFESVRSRVDAVRATCRQGRFLPRQVAALELTLKAYVDPHTYGRATCALVPEIPERRLLERWITEFVWGCAALDEDEVGDLGIVAAKLAARRHPVTEVLRTLWEEDIDVVLAEWPPVGGIVPETLRNRLIEILRQALHDGREWECYVVDALPPGQLKELGLEEGSPEVARLPMRRRLLAHAFPGAFRWNPRAVFRTPESQVACRPPDFRFSASREQERVVLTLATRGGPAWESPGQGEGEALARCIREMPEAPGMKQLKDRLPGSLWEAIRKEVLDPRSVMALAREWAAIRLRRPWVTLTDLKDRGAPRLLEALALASGDPVLEGRGWQRFVAWAWPGVVPQVEGEEPIWERWRAIDLRGRQATFEEIADRVSEERRVLPGQPTAEARENGLWEALVFVTGGCVARSAMDWLRQEHQESLESLRSLRSELSERWQDRAEAFEEVHRFAEKESVVRQAISDALAVTEQMREPTPGERERVAEIDRQLAAEDLGSASLGLKPSQRRRLENERFALLRRWSPMDAYKEEIAALRRYLRKDEERRSEDRFPAWMRDRLEATIRGLQGTLLALRFVKQDRLVEKEMGPESRWFQYEGFRLPWIRIQADVGRLLKLSQPSTNKTLKEPLAELRQTSEATENRTFESAERRATHGRRSAGDDGE